MKQLSNVQEAIKQAIEGGYNKSIHLKTLSDKTDVSTYLLDPLFWQALGKARGWGRRIIMYQKTWDEMSQTLRDKRSAEVSTKEFAPKWFETRLSNGDENKFWQSLP